MRNKLAVRLFLVALILAFAVVLPQCGTAFPRNQNSLKLSSHLAITSTDLPQGIQGKSYIVTLHASGGVWPYKWSIASGALPSGLSLQSSRGTVSGTPTAVGDYSVTFAVTDNTGDTSTEMLQLNVDANQLTITTTSLPDGMLTTPYSAQLQTSGGATPYTWSVTGGTLPPGLSLSSGGLIAGTPTKAGAYSATYLVTDSASQTATQSFSITIKSTTLAILTTSLPDGMLTASYSAQLQASGGTTPYTWSVTGGTLPPGLSLSSGGLIGGTPTKAGAYSATFRVADSSSQTATQSLSITVNTTTLTILTTSLPDGTLNKSYSAQLQASGGGTPYTWSIIGGALPAGLSLSSGGLISGTPTATGTSTATIQVKDSTLTGSQTAMTNLSILVVAALQITTSSLSSATVGKAYSAQLNAAGGSTPYTWKIASGSLPSGLTLGSSGAISGTPDASGTSSFSAEVKDASGSTVQKGLSIDVISQTQAQTAFYGVPWNGDGLSDLSPGRPDNVLDYRFRSPHTGSVVALRLYLIFANLSTDCTWSGHYAGGTGGRILVQLETDDGTSNHLPSGTVLASYTITNPLQFDPNVPNGRGSMLKYNFDSPASITAGHLYHLVFSDTDPNPSCNWTDIDNLYVSAGTPNIQPAYSDTDFALLNKGQHTSSNWTVNYKNTPIFNLYFSDGTTFGQGFVMKGKTYAISGSNKVRETFKVSGSDYTFTKAFARVKGTGTLTATIETASGSEVASGILSAPDSKGWASVTFPTPYTLKVGQTYHFVLSSSGSYSVWPMQAGTAYGMDPPNTFPDGHFQYSTDGSTWSDYSGNRTDFDLQFFLAP